MRKELYIKLSGNTGNQLFQFFFAASIKERFNFDKLLVSFPPSHPNQISCLSNMYTEVTREYINGKYSKTQSLINSIFHTKKIPFSWLPSSYSHSKHIYYKVNKLASFGIIEYRGTDYVRIKIPKKNKLFISGYFESKKYFEDYYSKDSIRELLFKQIGASANKFVSENITNNCVCVTIRRGNFLSDKYKDAFYVCDDQYFEKAIQLIREKVDNPKFIFFSDDIEWVKNNINYPENSTFESGNENAIEKLYMMSACKHFILSNSTFSWWAWYLSKSGDGGIVISPKSWRANQKDTHLIENDWILI